MKTEMIEKSPRIITFRVSQIVDKYISDLCSSGGESVAKMINRIIIEAHSKLDVAKTLDSKMDNRLFGR